MRPFYTNFRIKYFFGCCSKQGNTVKIFYFFHIFWVKHRKFLFLLFLKILFFFNFNAFFNFRNKNYCLDKAADYFENKTVYYPKSYLIPENLGLRRLINQVFGFSVCRLIRKKIHGVMRPLYSNFRIKYFFGCRS